MRSSLAKYRSHPVVSLNGLHLRAVRFTPEARADVRTMQRIQDETTEELRNEKDKVCPLLRWPMRKGGTK